MTSKKVLFISQVIEPYVPETPMSRLGKVIPQSIQDMGNEIRTFQPKWGNINERRNQLHEVIRLSGLNVIIDDTDHPLLIKVASLQSAHIQVYFIDSEDFFNKRLAEGDSKTKEYDDNYERSIFYTRSVIETIKKQRWYPDVIHCQGWISGTAPFFIRAAYQDELPFKETKIVYSLHGTKLKKPLPENFKDCLAFHNITAETVERHGMPLKSFSDFAKFSLSFCDGVIQAQNGASPELLAFAQEKGIPTLPYEASDSPGQRYADFYDSLF